ncbi:hypothetical protein UMM65_10700 [Aureibaculum sp. 2210JD6-5]|uniref:hypothetical protein n=1 Tax=Aureibaculum sp. 2210JD6-5 TaxID=3103957 RepID=UPI002AAD42A0|nr:hypothetical protein [Aureibaculum sp. 2210JD6-5]MDY7395713.1 hypothetical protein [Aureibaculum sp. 2210JD6-5]
MMKEVNIFDKKNIFLLEPYDGIEFIYSVLQNIGHYSDFTTLKARRDGLKVINQLFVLDLIEIFHWGKYQRELNDKKLSIFEIMMYIQELWFIGANFENFHNMPMFKYKNWYISELEKLGMTHTTDWEEFVKNKIGDLEKWIKENKPKDV